MRNALLLFCLIGLVIVAALLSCGTWVAQEESQLRDGLEYAVIHWHWQWHPVVTVARALGLLGGVGLLVGAACVTWRHASAAKTDPSRAARGVEPRRFKRCRCDWPVRYQVRSLPFERQATCVDISEGGMQCLMQERWVRHTPLELRVYPPAGAPVLFSGMVVWAKSADGHGDSSGGRPLHRIGIRFDAPASQQMSVLLRALADGVSSSVRA